MTNLREEMKKYILAVYDKEIPRLLLPPSWELIQLEDYSKGMKHIASYCPYFLVLKSNIKNEKATDFLKEVEQRFGVIPPSVILDLQKEEELNTEEKASLGIVAGFMKESSFKTIMKEIEPLLKEPPLPRMNILEFIATLMNEKMSGIYQFQISSSRFEIISREGKIECIVDEVFRNTYRDLLSQGGLELPPIETNIIKDIFNIDARGYIYLDKIKAIKEFAIEKTLSEFPLDQNYKFVKTSDEYPLGNTIGIECSEILRKLSTKIPLQTLEILKKCSFKKSVLLEELTKCVPLFPEEGYLLHILEGELSFNEIKTILGTDEPALLQKLYFLFILGFLSTNPGGGIPPRIKYLKEGILSREKLISSQSLSIEQFAQTLQIPGLSPYRVLGIDEKSTLVEAIDAFRNLEHLFRPEELDIFVQKKYSKHLTFIRSKLTEAILLIESFHFNGKHKQQEAAVSKMEKIERTGSGKTESQKIEEGRKKEAERLFLIAKEYFETDHIYEAGQYLKTALIYDPFSAPCRHLLALTYLKMKDMKSKYMAERELKLAIENDPWTAKYILDLARLYIEVDMPNRAKSLLEQAQRIDPTNPEIKTVKDLLKKTN